MSTLFLDIEKVYTFDNGDVLAVILSPSGSVMAETTARTARHPRPYP